MGNERTRSGSFALDTKVFPFDHAALLKSNKILRANIITHMLSMSLDSSSTALDSQPPLPPLRRLGLGVGCRQSHAERSAPQTLDNEKWWWIGSLLS